MHIVRIAAVWCSSCIVTYQDFVEFKKEHSNITFIELNYDQDDIEKYNVGQVLPLLVFEKEGVQVARMEGEYKKKDLEAMYEKVSL